MLAVGVRMLSTTSSVVDSWRKQWSCICDVFPFSVSRLERFSHQELWYVLVCYWPSVRSKKDIAVTKAKIQNGVFRPVSAEQVARNSERLRLDLRRVQSQKCSTGYELERHVPGPWW